MPTIATVLADFVIGMQTVVHGRVIALRKHGKVMFFDLDDRTAKIQVIITATMELDIPTLGDIVSVSGTLCVSKSNQQSLDASAIEPIVKCTTTIPYKQVRMPSRPHTLPRHVDLMVNDHTFEFFKKLSLFTHTIRSFLYGQGFLEFDTATLQSRFSGGFARPFTTDVNALGNKAYMRLTSELRLKRLIVGGFNRVFEIGKSFRNEGIDRMHHPEFTQIEIYEAFSDYRQMMTFVEYLLKHASSHVFGENNLTKTNAGWQQVPILEYGRSVFGNEFSFAMDKASVLHLSQRHLPASRSLNPASTLPQLFMDLLQKALFTRFVEPTFLYGFPSVISPLTKMSTDLEHGCEKAALIVSGRRICDLTTEENNPERLTHVLDEQHKLTGNSTDLEFMDAIRSGLPPTAGVSISLERTALFIQYGDFSHPVNEAILFPLT